MPTLNEAFATSFGEAKTPPPANTLDAAFDTTFSDDETKLRANLHTAVRTDPVKIARADTLAKETGLPTDMVARNLVNVELQRAVEKADSTLRTDPALLTKFKDSDLFAKKARDDIDALVNVHGELKAWKGPDANFTNVVKGLAASLPQGLEIVRQGMGAQMGDFLEWAGLIQRDDVYKEDRLRKMNQALGAGDFTRPDIESGTLRAVYGGVESTLRMLPGLAASVLTRNPTYALASAGLQSQGEAYAKYRGRGGAPLESFIGATGEGAVEVITEKLPTEFLTAAMGKKGFGEFITGLLAREVPTEQLATILQDAIDTAVANPDKTWSQYLAERPEAAYSTFISTVTQSALMGGAAAVVNRLSGQADKIADAEANARQLQKVLAATAQVKMREHSAGDFSRAMQSIAESEEGTRSSVFIDGEVLAQSVTIEELAQVLPSAISQLETAATTNGIVELPIGEVLANVQGTPLEQVLLQNARATPDAMSLAEAEDAVKLGGRWVEEAETLMQQAQEQDTIRASSEVVRKTILEQLNTTGAYRSSVNDALARVTAALFTTQAQRMNMTPEQAFQMSGFAVRGAGQQQGKGKVLNADVAVLDQGDVTVTDQVDETTGLPLNTDGTVTLYHHTSAANAEAVKTSGALRSAGEPSVYLTTRETPDTGYGDTVVKVRVKPELLQIDDEFPDGRVDYSVSVGRPGGALTDAQFNQAAMAKPYGKQVFSGVIEGLGLTEAETNSTVLEFMTGQAKDQAFVTPTFDGIPEVVQFLHNRRLASGLPVLDIKNEADREKLATLISAEALAAIQNAGDSLQWYDKTINALIAQMAVKYPELDTDPNARNALILATAIGSQGMNVETNLTFAQEQYAEFRKTGKFPEIGKGESSAAMANSFAVANKLIEKMGHPAFIEFLKTPYTVKQLTEMGYEIGGEKMDEMVLGSSIFGPKIGFGFYTNLTGNFEPVTMDMWFMRTIGRLSGTLPAFNQAKFDKQVERFRAGLTVRGKATAGIFSSQFDKDLVKLAKTDLDAAMKLARQVKSAHERDFKNNRADYDAGKRTKSEMVAAADTMILSMDKPRDVPGSGGERQLLRDVVRQVVAKVEQQYGQRIPPAALQALIWYPEQELWSALGVKLAVTSQDYAGAAKKILLKDGIDEAKLDAAIRAATGTAGEPGPGGVQPVSGGTDTRENRRVGDQDGGTGVGPQTLEQGPRGTYNPRNFEIVLNENANLSTYFHELSHFYLDFLGRMAEMPNASPEVVEDFNSFLNWTGVSQEQWREWRDFVIANPNKPLPKGMVKVHEALARAGEQYFLEGKAPSVELQPFMRRFARWMESVYTSLVNFIAGNPDKGLQLNADIRRFFDRALATDEQIAQAEQAAGMTPDDDATAEAKERLNKRSMAGFKWSVQMRDKIIADLRKQAKEIEDSIRQRVTEEVDEMPAMQARAALNQLMAASPEYKAELKAWDDARAAELARATEAVKEQLVAAEVARTNAPLEGLAKGRFLSQNRAEVENKAEAAALTWEKSNPKPRRITPDMTPQMESIADKYGYSSVDQMLQDIDAVGSRREMIDGLTEQRMLEEHGDLIDDRAIQQAANEAVHNDARARALAAELRTQQEMLGERTDTGRVNTKGRRITVNTLLAAARNFAANVVGRAKVMDLGNLSWKHNAAEARAGKRWQQLTAEGKTVEAVKAKQDQVIHNAAAKAALEAQAEIQKLLTYLKKFDKDSVRTKLPASYLDQIDKLLERVDLRVSTTRRDIDKRAALSKWIESQHALGLDPIVPDYLLDDAQLTSYKEMTVDQFRELADTIKNIEHFGRLKSRLLAAKDKREFDAIATEIANEIIANKGTPLQVQLEPDGRIKKFFKGAWADHRKLNSLVRQMDGGKDNGPFYRALVRSMNEAGTKENVMLEQATEALAKIYAPIEALPGGFSGAKIYIPEINASLSRAGRLAVALNWGNSTNRQRVMGGDNWTEAQVEAILATLSTTELEFVNNVWAQLDSYWPEMKAKQERVNGVVEDKVEAEPFELTAADGTVVQMRGGYYPIKYDSDRSLKSQKNEAQEVAADMLRGAILRPSTRRGHLKAREEEVNRPVRKDLSVITQHVNQVVHDLAWHEWLIDATRLLNDPRIAGAIRDYHGPEIHRAMTEAMRAIAEGDIAHQTEIDKLLLLMRANVTRSIMGASLTTALLQPFGLTQSMVRIGVVPVLKGAARWAGEASRMENSMKWIGEKSDFMRLRSKTFNRELREISQRVQGKSKFMQVADASLFFLMQKLQMVADVPTWIGAYEKALAGGVDDATAVQLADEAVLGSQGGGNTKDLAGVQRNMPFLTQFYSYFSTTLQLNAEVTARTDFKNPRAVAGWLADMVLLNVIPAILPALIIYLLKGGGEDDEPEDWAKRLAEWQASYLLGMFVGLRELPAVWSPFDYQGPPAGKLINDGKRLVQQAGQGEIDDEAVLATIGFLGTALGIPTIQMTRSYKGWLAWDEGDAPVTSILFGPPPKD
jgi:hypothetical protein